MYLSCLVRKFYRYVSYTLSIFTAIKQSFCTQTLLIKFWLYKTDWQTDRQPSLSIFILVSPLCCEVVSISWPSPTSSIQIGDSKAQCKEQSMQCEGGAFSYNGFYAVYIFICYQHFGTARWSLLQGPSSTRRHTSVSCVTTQANEDLIYILVGARNLTGWRQFTRFVW